MVLLQSHLVTIVHALQGLDDTGQVVLYRWEWKMFLSPQTRGKPAHIDRNRNSVGFFFIVVIIFFITKHSLSI